MIDRQRQTFASHTGKIISTAFLMFATTIALAQVDDAKSIVERLHGTLLEVMTEADSLGFSGRYQRLDPVLDDTFDFTSISRIITGRHWKLLGETKKQGFIDTFTKLSIATYASNFDGYSGERFETVGVDQRKGGVIVKTNLIKKDGEIVTLNYLLKEQDAQWRIINVIANGVSDLSLKRADYTAIIKSEGFDALVARLNGKIGAFKTNSN